MKKLLISILESYFLNCQYGARRFEDKMKDLTNRRYTCKASDTTNPNVKCIIVDDKINVKFTLNERRFVTKIEIGAL